MVLMRCSGLRVVVNSYLLISFPFLWKNRGGKGGTTRVGKGGGRGRDGQTDRGGEGNADEGNISWNDIKMVQDLIERCLQHHMTLAEIVSAAQVFAVNVILLYLFGFYLSFSLIYFWNCNRYMQPLNLSSLAWCGRS